MSQTTDPVVEEGAPASPSALDEPARRGLARQRRRGWLLVIGGLAIVAPAGVLWVWNQRFHDTGTRVDATVAEVDTGIFDRVTVVYRVDGQRHRSVVHLDDADKYCLPSEYDDDDRCEEAEPVVVVDPSDPGHATLLRELNLSPPATVVFKASFFLLVCLVPLLMLVLGVIELVRAGKHRRVLAQGEWAVHQSRARSQRTFEVSPDGLRWRTLSIKVGPQRHKASVRREERVEIVTFGEGRALVRAPGSDAIVAGSLGPPGRSASDSVAQTAGVRGAPPNGGNLRSARAFVLVGALLQYDILDLDGGPLGSVTSKTGFRLSCTVRDRAGRQLFRVVRSSFGRWIVRQPDGSVIASGRRWLGASTVELGPTGMAVRASRTSLQFQERVVLPSGARAPFGALLDAGRLGGR